MRLTANRAPLPPPSPSARCAAPPPASAGRRRRIIKTYTSDNHIAWRSTARHGETYFLYCILGPGYRLGYTRNDVFVVAWIVLQVVHRSTFSEAAVTRKRNRFVIIIVCPQYIDVQRLSRSPVLRLREKNYIVLIFLSVTRDVGSFVVGSVSYSNLI